MGPECGAGIDCVFMEKALVRIHPGVLQGQCQHRYFVSCGFLPTKIWIPRDDLTLCLFVH